MVRVDVDPLVRLARAVSKDPNTSTSLASLNRDATEFCEKLTCELSSAGGSFGFVAETKDGRALLEALLLEFADRQNTIVVKALIDAGASGTLRVNGRCAHELTPGDVALRAILGQLGAFAGRYRIGKQIHDSATAKIVCAVDVSKKGAGGEGEEAKRVVIKFMLDRGQFNRELQVREELGDAMQPYIMPIEAHSNESEEFQTRFTQDAIAQGYFPLVASAVHVLCIVDDAGGRAW